MRRRILIISCSSIVGLALILLAILSYLPTLSSEPTTQPVIVTSPYNIAFYASPTNFVLHINGFTDYFLTDFELRTHLDGQIVTIPITNSFPAFDATDGVATLGGCYVFGIENTASGLPDVCQHLDLNVYTNSRNFWWDADQNQRRNIAIGRVGEPTSRICLAWQPMCTFVLDVTSVTPVVVVAAAPSTQPAIPPAVVPAITPTVTLFVPTISFVPTTPLLTSNQDWQPVFETVNGIEFVLVPAGCFMMGSTLDQLNSVLDLCLQYEPECNTGWYTDETPAHQQCFDEPFWITRYEITNNEYGGVGVYSGETRPREFVSFEMASGYCERRGWRLPTEAEWEYAARGPDALIFPWGDTFLSTQVVYSGNSNVRTAAVDDPAIRNESWVGAYHMSGNVWEWTSSFYTPSYDAADDQVNTQDVNAERVVRGGSFVNDPMFQRTTQRLHWGPNNRNGGIGFRCVRPFEGQ